MHQHNKYEGGIKNRTNHYHVRYYASGVILKVHKIFSFVPQCHYFSLLTPNELQVPSRPLDSRALKDNFFYTRSSIGWPNAC